MSTTSETLRLFSDRTAFTLPPTKTHSGVLQEERPELVSLVSVEPLLLVERQQAGRQVEAALLVVRVVGKIQNPVVFAEAVP